jgi:hypothetical protein
LDDLEEEELLGEEGEGVGTPSVASTAFYSTVREVSLQIVLRLVFLFQTIWAIMVRSVVLIKIMLNTKAGFVRKIFFQ